MSSYMDERIEGYVMTLSGDGGGALQGSSSGTDSVDSNQALTYSVRWEYDPYGLSGISGIDWPLDLTTQKYKFQEYEEPYSHEDILWGEVSSSLSQEDKVKAVNTILHNYVIYLMDIPAVDPFITSYRSCVDL